MLLTPAQIKPKSFESRRNSFLTRGGCISCLRACLGARLLPQSYQYPNLSEGADRVGGQLRRDREGPFSGVTKPSLISLMVSVDVKHHVYLLTCVTKSGRVCRKMPESDAHSVGCMVYTERAETAAVSRGTSHVTIRERCKYTTLVDIQIVL